MSAKDTTDHIGTSSRVNATAASILGLLTRSPLTGWEIFATFEQSIGHFWSITRSQVYREIQSLAVAGLIVLGETGARERRVCTITAAGRVTFGEWISGVPGEALIRFPLLLTAFFGDALTTDELRSSFELHRGQHVERLADYERLLPAAADHDPFPAHALRFGIAYERTVLEWIDSLPWMTAEPDELVNTAAK